MTIITGGEGVPATVPELITDNSPAQAATTASVNVLNPNLLSSGAKPINTVFVTWAAAIYPGLITLLTAAAVLPHAHSTIDLLQFAILFFATAGAIFARVLPAVTGWPGILKTGILIVGALLSGSLAFIQQNGDFSTFNVGSWLLFLAACANAVVHEVGIQQRTTANDQVAADLLASKGTSKTSSPAD